MGNPYKLFPKCPECEKIGSHIDKGIKQCLSESCKVGLYWKGGFSEREKTVSNDAEFEKELHSNKEDFMTKSLKRKVHSTREKKMSDVFKRFLKKEKSK